MIRLVREVGRTCDACRTTGIVTLEVLEAGGKERRICDSCAALAEKGRRDLRNQGLDAITLFQPIPWGQP